MGAGFHGGFGGTQGAKDSATAELVAGLEKSGVKFTKENIVFIAKDGTGQTVWLETGNASAGLKHILDGDGRSPGHASDFEKAFGVSRERVPELLHKVVSEGTVVSNTIKIRNGREGYERVYSYGGKYYVVSGIGKNGFIVSAYPVAY